MTETHDEADPIEPRAKEAPRANVAFIGTVGIPNRYGGFEAFLEHCAPVFVERGAEVTVTCDASRYDDRGPYKGVERVFVPISANGISSIVHDLWAFLAVWGRATRIVVLGVSGGLWFPLFRLLCAIRGQRLVVNIDGVEWQRGKFSRWKRRMLWLFDWLAQRFAHEVVIDNEALRAFVIPAKREAARLIAYPGDYVLACPDVERLAGHALTVCRIEPENNIHLLLEAARKSGLAQYRLIGNWDASEYGRTLRARYRDETRFELMDPVYDPEALARYRTEAAVYIHGHSVGGTNPSLVEMLFYDGEIVCFDVPYHRETAGDAARYFVGADDLAAMLDDPLAPDLDARVRLRRRYTREAIVLQYEAAIGIEGAQPGISAT